MLQKSSILRNQQQKFQQKLYRFFHLVVKHYSLHINIYYVLLIIQILQICNYGIHYSFGDLWNTPLSNFFRYLLRTTDLSPIWINSNISLVIFVAICLMINFVVLGLILYDSNKKIDYDKEEGQQNMSIVKFIGFYGIILQKILFLPMVLAFSTFVHTQTYALTLSLQISLAILSILGFISLFMIMSLFILFYRDNSPFSKLPFSSAVNYQAQILALIKVILAIYGGTYASTINKPMTSVVICFFFIIALSYLCYQIYKNPGIIQYPFNRIAQLCPVFGVWFYLCSILQLYFTPEDRLGFYLLLIGIILLPFACSIINTLKVGEILTKNYKNIDTIEHYLIYNYECIKLGNHNEDVISMQTMQGIINYHISQCKKPPEICFCSKIRNQLLQFKLQLQRQDIEKERHLVFQFIEMNLQQIKEKYPRSPDIRFLLSYIYQQILHNKFKALHSLQQAREIGGGYRFQFLEYHFLRQIQSKMSNDDRIRNQKKPVDINRYYNFQMKFGKLQQIMECSSYQYVRFWEMLKSQKVSVQKIYDEGKKIIADIQKIRKTFQSIIAINSSNIHCQILYSNFMKVIANNSEPYNRSKEHIQLIKRSLSQNFKISQQFQKEKYGDNAISGVIIISGQRTNIGIIKHCNWKVGELIGYAPHQLVGQNINVIMPKFIGNMHDDVLRNYLELSRSEFDYVERLVPMIDCRNFMILARVLTKPLPSLINGLQLVGIFNQVHESNNYHITQLPKYVLYRSDTGQVQALSQSCYEQFNYKINKINEFNETSSQLTFKTLFQGLRQSDIIDGKINRGKIVVKGDNLLQREQIPVDIKLRLNIYYFSVNLRLLCFYTAKQYHGIQSRVNMTIQTIKKQQNVSSYGHQIQWDKQNDKNDRSVIVHNKASKQKFLHQISKKQQLIQKQPTNLKVLKGIGYAIFFIVTILAIVYTILHSQTQEIKDYINLTKYSGQSTTDIFDILTSSRALQFLNSINYQRHQSNISYLVNTLQDSQFQIQSIYVKYGKHQSDQSLDFVLQMNGQILITNRSLDVNVFDFVTSASSLKIAGKQQTSFKPNILSNLDNITIPLINMFKVHYTGIYEIIPNKIKYDQKFQTIFIDRFNTNQKNIFIQMIIVVCFLIVVLIIMLCIQRNVIQLADKTILLFGHMTRGEIQKEIENCNHFLDLFYQDSYLIHLKKKQKKRGQNQFAIDDIKSKLNNKIQDNKNKDIVSMNFDNQSVIKKQPSDIFIKTVSKMEYLQKQLHLRTQAQILITQRENDNENQGLRAQESTQDATNIYDKLSQNQKNSFTWFFIMNIFIIMTFCSYFNIQFNVNKNYLHKIYDNIGFIHLTYKNIYTFHGVKMLSLDNNHDKAKFMNYPLKSQTASQYYKNLYHLQRDFDRMHRTSEVKLPFYYGKLCDEKNLAKISPYSNLFAANLFTKQQCTSILKGSLHKGVRLAIVGFIEANQDYAFISPATTQIIFYFHEGLSCQKYIDSSFLWFTAELQSLINKQIKDKLSSLITLTIIFIIILWLQWMVIWKINLNLLLERITSSRKILQFIPVRIFSKNVKLTKQYEDYLGNITK